MILGKILQHCKYNQKAHDEGATGLYEPKDAFVIIHKNNVVERIDASSDMYLFVEYANGVDPDEVKISMDIDMIVCRKI